MVNESKIKCFLSLARTLSFTETARLLYMTQQAVSKHIAQLEETFGFPLFTRSRRSVALTPEGERCYALFQAFYAEYEAFLAAGRAQHGKGNAILRVGYQNWLDFGSAPGRARNALRKEIPGLELAGERYSPDLLYDRLRAGTLDLILILDSYVPDMEGLCALPLLRTPLVLMVSPEHPGAMEGATWERFVGEPVLFDYFEREAPPDTLRRAEKKLADCSFSSSQIIAVPNRDSVYTDVELGRGVAIGAEMSHFVHAGSVKTYPLGVEETLLCVWRADETNGVAARYAACMRQAYQQTS